MSAGGAGAGAAPCEVKSEAAVKVEVEAEGEGAGEGAGAGEQACAVCGARGPAAGWSDAYWTETPGSRTPLVAYVCRVAGVRPARAGAALACRACLALVAELERAELEYYRLRDAFVAVVTAGSAFEAIAPDEGEGEPLGAGVELCKRERDSDDEPLLARNKRAQKPAKRKETKTKSKIKRVDSVIDVSFKCTECDEVLKNSTEEAVHMLVVHRGASGLLLEKVKQEDEGRKRKQNQRYSSPLFDNETHFGDDDDNDWNPVATSEPVDNEFQPATKKAKAKTRSLINSKKGKQTATTTKVKKVSIPVLGEVPNKMVEIEVQENEWEVITGQQSAGEKKRRKYTKSQPKVVYPCKECDSTFHSLSRLTFHMAKHEAAKAPFICEICGAHYKHKKACDVHVMMHKGISDWKCEECNKLFPSKGALHRHNGIHTGKPNYQCDLCGKSFIHTSSFKMHKLSHTGLKPHSCDICGLALMTRSHLKRHKRIHSGEKRHECPICGKKFSERYNLLAHQKSHEGMPTTTTERPPRPRAMFRCHLCENRFERRYMVEKHMEVVHQRIMEKGPPRPRNTMTKLLKAQALAANKKSATNGTEDQSEILRKALTSMSAEESPDVKPVIASSAKCNAKTAASDTSEDAIKNSPPEAESPARPTETTLGFQDGVRPVGAVWTSNTYIAAEYNIRMTEFQQ